MDFVNFARSARHSPCYHQWHPRDPARSSLVTPKNSHRNFSSNWSKSSFPAPVTELSKHPISQGKLIHACASACKHQAQNKQLFPSSWTQGKGKPWGCRGSCWKSQFLLARGNTGCLLCLQFSRLTLRTALSLCFPDFLAKQRGNLYLSVS